MPTAAWFLCTGSARTEGIPAARLWRAVPAEAGVPSRTALLAASRRTSRKTLMAANLRFAARDFGGKCERGTPLSQKSNDQSESRRRAPEARKEVPIPEPGGVGVGYSHPNSSRSGVCVRLSPHLRHPTRSVELRGGIANRRAEKHSWQRTSGSLPAISGESVKGEPPFHKKVTTNRNLAAARRRRAREFRLPTRSVGAVPGWGHPPNSNHVVTSIQTRGPIREPLRRGG